MLALVLVVAQLPLVAQLPQNPSPMSESTRRHERVVQRPLAGQQIALSLGTLHVPAKLARKKAIPLVVHFHGAAWIAQQATERHAVLAVELGAGSARYAAPLREAGRFAAWIAAAERASGHSFSRIFLSSFSAGYGAVREILRQERGRIAGVVLADSLHAGYGSEAQDLDSLLWLAREAASGRMRFLVTHSEVYPGTYASTTETADRLLAEAGLRRKAVLRWGPLGMQQLSVAKRGRFELLGFAGNSAPDHVDHLHALSAWWKRLR